MVQSGKSGLANVAVVWSDAQREKLELLWCPLEIVALARAFGRTTFPVSVSLITSTMEMASWTASEIASMAA